PSPLAKTTRPSLTAGLEAAAPPVVTFQRSVPSRASSAWRAPSSLPTSTRPSLTTGVERTGPPARKRHSAPAIVPGTLMSGAASTRTGPFEGRVEAGPAAGPAAQPRAAGSPVNKRIRSLPRNDVLRLFAFWILHLPPASASGKRLSRGSLRGRR